MPPTVTAVLVVSFEEPEVVREAIESLRRQTRPPDETVVVDNDPAGRISGLLAGHEAAVFLRPGTNLGYPPACNYAAARTEGDYLFFLNPDADADERCVERLVAAGESDPHAAVVGAQVLLADGSGVNAGDNPIHTTGLSWAGRYGQRPESGPCRSALAVSGAALLARRVAFEQLGGFADGFFLYYDDADYCWRARLAGFGVRFCPEAVVRHGYEFEKGAHKWFWLERNRLWSVLANFRARTLLVLAPQLVAAEMAIVLFAARGGWLVEKLRAYGELVRGSRRLLAHRRAVQRARRVADAELLGEFAAAVDSPFLPVGPLRLVAPLMRAYHALALRLVQALGA